MDKEYRIVAKLFEVITFIGYVIEDNEGNRVSYGEANIKKLIRKGFIKNAKLVLNADTGQYDIIVDNYDSLGIVKNISEEKYTLVCRIVGADNKCIGYKVCNSNNEIKKVKIKTIWKLAVDGKISNVRAYILKDMLVLEGTNGFKLSELALERIVSTS